MKVRVKRLSKDVKMPGYAHAGDAGVDLYATQETSIEPGAIALVPTGIKIALPEGFEAQVRPKSGLALNHGLTVLNTPGTIDAGYRGEIGVIIVNHGKEEFKIEKGKKIAQMVFNKVEKAELEEVDELDETQRGEGGFGSTGLE
ncbi:MAG: dUTP diphosphatase [Candidatus Diapherotrites archaeon]|uniref:dUTP diphosphatase n=1 Tax=Candidatus Iainarchaeum sp. TaxID=3101447 RepID=A0A2D6M0N0_9ARCH|nr:dUTP diphosphatase [Candidatus Diapherotrites archaeon]